MNILDYLSGIGIDLKRCGNNEYMGACPFCGGEDRFRVWIDEGLEGLGKWACRQGLGNHPGKPGKEFACVGDLIDLIMELEGKSFQEVKEILELDNFNAAHRIPYQAKQESLFSEEKPKNQTWIDQAKRFVEEKAANLLNDNSTLWEGGSCLRWLQEKRCLSLATIKRFKLGLTTEFEAQNVDLWGLEPYTDREGKTIDKLTFYRQNLIIPTWRRGGYIDRIKVRFSKPTANNQRYTTIRGSNDNIAVYGKPSRIYVVVESELDSILLAQECPQVCPVCLGGAGKRPTKALAEEIKAGDICFLCLDSDEPGAAKLGYWLDNFKNSKPLRIPAEFGKDPTELELNYRQGKSPVNLSMFIEMGLELAKESKPQELEPQAEVKPIEADHAAAEILQRECEIVERAVRLSDKMSDLEQGYFKTLIDEAEQAEKQDPKILVMVLNEIEDLANKVENKGVLKL
jgi:DNA primase